MEEPQELIDTQKRIQHMEKLLELFRETQKLLDEINTKKPPINIHSA
jgi:hypothetical protein